MKNLKNLLAAVTLMAVLMIGATTTRAGLLVSDFTGGTSEPCTETNDETKVDSGIIVAGITGIIVAGFTGIIVAGVADSGDSNTDCGIIVAD